jgi:hypothetical protein
LNRITVVKNRDYVVVNHTIAKNKEISLKAKGLFFTVMALPDNWDFSIEGICKILKEEKTAVYSAIKELKEHGYCKVEKIHDDDGKIKKWEYFFYEVPLSGFPQVDDPQVGEPQVENQPQSNKEEINSLPQSSNDIKSSSSSAEIYKEIYPNEKLTDDEVDYLNGLGAINENVFRANLKHWKFKNYGPKNFSGIMSRYERELGFNKEIKQNAKTNQNGRGTGRQSQSDHVGTEKSTQDTLNEWGSNAVLLQ